MKKVPVWDLPTRLFHWLLVGFLCFSFITAKVEALQDTELHMMSGYGILSLILFRLGWGFWGGTYARFSQFLKGPRACAAYLRHLFAPDFPSDVSQDREDESSHSFYLGHNPVGGWMIVIMLSIILIQIATGLFANDDILYEGPLAYKVSEDTSSLLTVLHKQNYYFLLCLIFFHLAAIAFYRIFKRQSLVKPMLTGYKWVTKKTAQTVTTTEDSNTNWWLATGLACSAGLIVYAVIYWL
ncbi:MAG: cytochrome b/b6 domain-containing protein [Gammaproteobacteria bacterium]|nr:cytochrome b/b6 domain-containing protein [Gammaproteobacteria bacterium]